VTFLKGKYTKTNLRCMHIPLRGPKCALVNTFTQTKKQKPILNKLINYTFFMWQCYKLN